METIDYIIIVLGIILVISIGIFTFEYISASNSNADFIPNNNSTVNVTNNTSTISQTHVTTTSHTDTNNNKSNKTNKTNNNNDSNIREYYYFIEDDGDYFYDPETGFESDSGESDYYY